jgi:hypothetical protein
MYQLTRVIGGDILVLVKRLIGEVILAIATERNLADQGEVQRRLSLAITNLEQGEMWLGEALKIMPKNQAVGMNNPDQDDARKDH